ncbi:Hypothetical protein LUCI_4504 [Lucifera butyrica]|uniref:Uncharacterized protein n=1 Tax=Lucifera butyrica TaxID=1351585 RepID=A0A498RE58_9FIRM|nr:Hypothetical protein LUCI_4504 [Lucifera butyrica]
MICSSFFWVVLREQILSVYTKTVQNVDYRGMEQLVARRAHNPKAAGSSPAPATMIFNMPNEI